MSAESDVPEAMLGWQSAEVLVRGHGEGQESALRELGIAVDEFVPTSLSGEFVFDADVKALPPDAAALVEACEARAAKATAGPWVEQHGSLYDGNDEHLGEIDNDDNLRFVLSARTDIPALCALVRRLNGQLGGLEQANREAHQGIAKLKASHAREREGLLGDKKHLSDELKAATERITGLERQWDRFEALLRAYHAGVDRDQLMAVCVERWGPSTSIGASDLRGLAEREANR